MRAQSRTTLGPGSLLKLVTAVLFMLPLTVQLAEAGGRNANPGVAPPSSHAHGRSYGEWSAAWWQWALSLPATEHPLFDTADCSTGQSGKVWFLGGKFCSSGDTTCSAQSATRSCTVPTGTALFFPIANTECSSVEGNGSSEAELRACAQLIADLAANLSATVDGRAIEDLDNPGKYRVQSPMFEFTLASHDNILAAIGETFVPDGATSPAVADGIYLLLPPLSAGHHTITFHAEFPDFEFEFDITYNVIVVGGKH